MKMCFVKTILFVSALTCALCVSAEEKVQTIHFLASDGQAQQFTKVYELKHARAIDLLPFVKTTIKKSKIDSNVSAVNDVENNRQLLIVTTKPVLLDATDQLIAVLDRPSKSDALGSVVEGTGVSYGTYAPKYRGNQTMRDIIVNGGVSSYAESGTVEFDAQGGIFYFKDSPSHITQIKEKLSWLDQPIPQVKIDFTIYELRDSELRDIGIDYLAWKNGPGLNLFEAGYSFLTAKAAEMLVQSGTQQFGNFAGGFGGFYTAPVFDFSFIRLLQQHGKAIINSTASIVVTNDDTKVFNTYFAPEYQNIQKDKDHKASVAPSIAGGNFLSASINGVNITGTKDGVVNLSCNLQGSGVVERNNLGAEITAKTLFSTSCGLFFDKPKVLANWVRTSEVEQTIGIPFLCELPILKYIFGTTTKNQETVYYVVTAKATPISISEKAEPGIVQEFNEVAKK